MFRQETWRKHILLLILIYKNRISINTEHVIVKNNENKDMWNFNKANLQQS